MRWVWILVMGLAAHAWAAPYEAPNVIGRADASCLGAGNPYPCCTGPSVGNCIKDTDFTAHTEALERVDAILLSDATKTANYVLAGPASGSAATPTWRALVLADIPDDSVADKCQRSGGSGGNPAWEACQPEVIITDAPYSASGDGNASTDETSAFETALAAARRVVVPAGDYSVCNLDVNQQDGQVLDCEPGVIIRPTSACSAGSNTIIATATTEFADGVTIRGCTIRSDGITAAVSINGRSVRNVLISGVTFDLVGGGTRGMTAQGVDGVIVEGSTFRGDAGASGTAPIGCSMQRGMRNVMIRTSTFTGLKDGILIDDDGATMHDIAIGPGNTFDAFWPFLAPWTNTNCGGSGLTNCEDDGGDVTWTDNTSNVVLTDSDASFPTFTVQDTVLALTVLDTGTVSAQSSGTRLEDTGATFLAAGVRADDLVETSTAWARVIATPPSETQVYTTGWRSRTTYKPVASPAASTAFTVYRPLMGHITSNTGTTVTMGTSFAGMHDMLGVDTVPAAGTRYRIIRHPTYPLQVEAGAIRGRIHDNTFLYGWADQLSVFGDGWTIADNLVHGGQDGGITLTGDRLTATGNVVTRNGHAGIHATGGTDLVIANNVVTDNVWTNSLNTTTLADVRCGFTAQIRGNIIKRTDSGQPQSRQGVAVTSTGTGCVIDGNTFGGHATTGVTVLSGAAGTVIGRNTGLTYTNAATGTAVDTGPLAALFASLGTPANGSMVYCSDCTKATPCAGSGNGALAKRLNSAWDCD